MTTRDKSQFSIGDIVYDHLNKDVGVLIRKYLLFEGIRALLDDPKEEIEDIMVWDIFWTGPNTWLFDSGIQTYTEDGLRILLEAGALELYKNT